ADDAVAAPGAGATLEAKPKVTARDDRVTRPAIRTDTANVRQNHTRLARDVGPGVPGTRLPVERQIGEILDVLHPTRFGNRRGFDYVVRVLARKPQALG